MIFIQMTHLAELPRNSSNLFSRYSFLGLCHSYMSTLYFHDSYPSPQTEVYLWVWGMAFLLYLRVKKRGQGLVRTNLVQDMQAEC